MVTMSTIVSMFFDIRSFPDATEKTRDIDFYLQHGKSVLELPYPLVFFCEESSLEKIKKIRGNDYPTKYIVKNLREYEYFRNNWEKIKENREKSIKYQNKNLKSTVSYYLLTVFKFLAISITKQENPFHSSYFMWIDLGCDYICRNMNQYVSNIIEKPKPKVCVMYIHYRGKEELKDMKHYMEYGAMCGIAAGIFTVQKEYVDDFYNCTFSIFNEMTEKGVGHFEEQILTYAYDRYPEIFTLYFGDYYSLFENYHSSLRDLGSIHRYFIQECLAKNRKDLADQALQTITFRENECMI